MGNTYFKLNGQGIPRLKKMITNRVKHVKSATAEHAYKYLVDFGYHAFFDSGPHGMNGPGWLFYYAANWNCSVKDKNLSNISPERYSGWGRAYISELQQAKSAKVFQVFNQAKLPDSVFVTNSAWYGKYLNNGGFLYNKKWGFAHGNNFIELCHAELLSVVGQIINQATKVY